MGPNGENAPAFLIMSVPVRLRTVARIVESEVNIATPVVGVSAVVVMLVAAPWKSPRI
jgi:hypothetical protein